MFLESKRLSNLTLLDRSSTPSMPLFLKFVIKYYKKKLNEMIELNGKKKSPLEANSSKMAAANVNVRS
jgi:hypothetical protein